MQLLTATTAPLMASPQSVVVDSSVVDVDFHVQSPLEIDTETDPILVIQAGETEGGDSPSPYDEIQAQDQLLWQQQSQ